VPAVRDHRLLVAQLRDRAGELGLEARPWPARSPSRISPASSLLGTRDLERIEERELEAAGLN
jgi:hypothetical protein